MDQGAKPLNCLHRFAWSAGSSFAASEARSLIGRSRTGRSLAVPMSGGAEPAGAAKNPGNEARQS